ncbi:MAG: Transglutaminase-like domain [Bryobacterales bacterium]|nr:Transglutaminase-like domain [Bryobacterales bacterium]
MLIRLGYDIRFDVPCPTPIVALLNVHPSRVPDLREPDEVQIEPATDREVYTDSFGNTCLRVLAETGTIRFSNSTLIADSGEPDPREPGARQIPVEKLPTETLRFLLASRYCEVDLLSNIAHELFGQTAPGWERVEAICEWVNQKVTFGYAFARSTKTALDVYLERQGVCRDFQHLAVTFCRSLNIPARYATGYLGDIGVPAADSPMDFSAWFEAYLDGRWWTFDARHNRARIGRVLMATGRDAADVAITTSFGATTLTKFEVVSDEIKEESPHGVSTETAVSA